MKTRKRYGARCPCPTQAEVVEFIATHGPHTRSAISFLVERFYPLMSRVARSYSHWDQDLEDELIGECHQGLLRAATTYDPDKVACSFEAVVIVTTKQMVWRTLSQIATRRKREKSFFYVPLTHREGTADKHDVPRDVIDEKTVTSLECLETADLQAYHVAIVKELLTSNELLPEDRELLRLRFGLDGAEPHTLQALGPTRNGVQMKLKTVFRRARRYLSQRSIRQEHIF